jgi:hypothetical protein
MRVLSANFSSPQCKAGIAMENGFIFGVELEMLCLTDLLLGLALALGKPRQLCRKVSPALCQGQPVFPAGLVLLHVQGNLLCLLGFGEKRFV